MTLTIRDYSKATFIAGANDKNYNFRSTSSDIAAGSFTTYAGTNTGLFFALGAAFNLVSFPSLTVTFSPVFY